LAIANIEIIVKQDEKWLPETDHVAVNRYQVTTNLQVAGGLPRWAMVASVPDQALKGADMFRAFTLRWCMTSFQE
jgi:hypothetical protein